MKYGTMTVNTQPLHVTWVEILLLNIVFTACGGKLPDYSIKDFNVQCNMAHYALFDCYVFTVVL